MGPAIRVSAVVCSIVLSACNCSQRLVGAAADLRVEPDQLDFGTRLAGSTASAPVELRNQGKVAASISSIRIEADARGAFSTPATPFTVEPGGAFQFTVAYAAPAAATDTATLFLTADGVELAVALQGQSVLDCSTTNCTIECSPRTCGTSCGQVQDGCGKALDCGACVAPPDAGSDAGTDVPDAGP